jgi:hypothetical protein
MELGGHPYLRGPPDLGLRRPCESFDLEEKWLRPRQAGRMLDKHDLIEIAGEAALWAVMNMIMSTRFASNGGRRRS